MRFLPGYLKLVLVLTALGSTQSFAVSCLAGREQCREIMKLVSIVQVNEKFLAGLDRTDEAERNQTRSNLRIAGKRIAALSSRLPRVPQMQ